MANQLKQSRNKFSVSCNGNSMHSFAPKEVQAFVNHLNTFLKGDEDLEQVLPLKSDSLFNACKDGLVLSKFLNIAKPGVIPEQALNKGHGLSPFAKGENTNLVVSAAEKLGCHVVNCGSDDIMEGREHIVLGLIWQIIKAHICRDITIEDRPELDCLFPLLDHDEILKIPAEKILLRWVNYHLRAAKSELRISNFSADIKDSKVYTILLNQLSGKCDLRGLELDSLRQRAERVLENAAKLGVHDFICSESIISGSPKLNMAFTACIFNACSGLNCEDDAPGFFDSMLIGCKRLYADVAGKFKRSRSRKMGIYAAAGMDVTDIVVEEHWGY